MSYSGLFTPGPSPRGRSASRHDDNIFGSPRSRSSGSKSRPRLLEPKLDNPLDLIFGSFSPSRRSGRCRRPSISVAYAGASFTTARTHDSDYLEPIFASPTSRAPRSPRYPPSASKSGSLLYTSAGPPADDRDGGGARSRPRHRSPISLGDAANTDIFPVKFGTGDLLVYRPDSSSRRPRASSSVRRALDPFKPRSGTTSWSGSGDYASGSSAGDAFEPSRILRRPTAPALEQPFRSKFFGSGSSSSGSGPSAPHPLEGDPSVTSRRRSRSSGRSKESSLLGRVSGDDDFALPPPTTSAGRTNTRRPPQLRRTSFVSGFSDQMEYDEHGQEHFRSGTERSERYNAYKNDNRNATDAIVAYKEKKAQFPPRRRVISGPDAAIGNSYGLGGNFTIAEREPDGYYLTKRVDIDHPTMRSDKDLRYLAHQGFKHRRAETIGRESFNRDYGKFRGKRTRQTERSSDENHEQVARGVRQNANDWLDVRERHAEAQLDLGYPDTHLTSYSSWGSHGGSHRS